MIAGIATAASKRWSSTGAATAGPHGCRTPRWEIERCQTGTPSRKRGGTSGKANRRARRPASSCTRRSTGSAAARMARARRGRRSPSAFPRRGAPVSTCRRRGRERPRRARARAPGTPMRSAKADARRHVAPRSRKPSPGCSSASREARHPALRCRGRARGPRRAGRRLIARRRRRRLLRRRAPRVAPLPPVRRRAPGVLRGDGRQRGSQPPRRAHDGARAPFSHVDHALPDRERPARGPEEFERDPSRSFTCSRFNRSRSCLARASKAVSSRSKPSAATRRGGTFPAAVTSRKGPSTSPPAGDRSRMTESRA